MRTIQYTLLALVLGLPAYGQARTDQATELVKKHWEFGALSLDLSALEDAGLGLAYSYDKRWGDAGAAKGFDFGLKVDGLLSSEQKRNSANFQVAKLDVSWFGLSGGASRAATVDPEFDPAVVTERVLEISDLRAYATDPDQKRKLADEQHALEAISGLESHFYHWNVGVNAGIEANQATTLKNYTFGLSASLDTQWQDDSKVAKWNFLDYPAALIRRISRMDEHWSPRGYGPTFVVAADLVDPHGSGPRANAGDDSGFTRLSAEVAFKTPLFRFRKDTYYLDTSYRYFDEFNAAASVRAADLDAFDYWAVGITSSSGLFLTYRRGQLPFDADSSEAFELGFKTYF